MPLSIVIDSNTTKIQKDMGELKSDLAAFKTQLEKATDTATISRLNKAIKETDTAIKSIKGFDGGKIAAGAGQAGNALTNLGRVVSDAPFGYVAIQNNLDPLIQSYQYLVRETGSAKNAIKALGSQLMGAGGLALAFSVVSSTVTAVIQKYGSLGDAIDILTSNSGAAALAQKDMGEAFAVASGKAAGEIAMINALLIAARDTTASRESQRQAISKLNSEYDKYLPKLTEENINAASTQKAIDKLTESLIRQAKVQGLKDLITKETQKQAEAFSKSLGSSATTMDNIVALAKSFKIGGNFFTEQQIQGAGRAAQNYNEAQKKIDLFTKSLIGLVGAEADAGTLFNSTAKAVDHLKNRISALKEIQSTIGLDFQQRGELTRLEIELAKRDDVIKLGFTKAELAEKIKFLIGKYVPSVEIEPSLIAKPKLLTDGATFDIAKAIGLPETITPPAMTINAPSNVNSDPFADAIGDAFGDSISLVSEKIGESFASGDFLGGLRETAQGILSILGDTLINIGKQLIVTSALVKGLKAALRGIFGPGGDAIALAAGIGLVAFGGFLKNIQFQGPKLADGGIVSGSTIANIGEAGTEVVAPLTKLPYLMNQAAGGGSGGMVVGLRIKGRELLAMLEREKSFAKRLG
jgi:hypothetical protein